MSGGSFVPVSPQLGERKKSEEPGSFEVNDDDFDAGQQPRGGK